MGRMKLGRVGGALVVVCVLGAVAAGAERKPPARQGLTYEQTFAAGYGRADPPGLPAEVPTISEWVDAGHYRETRRDADGRRKVFITAAAECTSRVVGDPDLAEFAPGAAFRIATRNHDLVWIGADGSERALTATPTDEEHVR